MKFRIEPLGDCALLVELGERIDAAINAQAIALADVLRAAKLADVFDIAPAYASVCVRYVPTHADARERLIAAITAFAESAASLHASDLSERACVEVPVCYGGEF